MCGIAGLVLFERNPRLDPASTARAMAEMLIHRGPDAFDVWHDSGVAFGHTRLAVIDTSDAGSQPMTCASGRWVISYNGEIYNFGELAAELETSGLRRRSDSDTEVLVEAIDRWGIPATLARLDGMFAFSAWDRNERRLYLARDRFGEKPLYYGTVGSAFVFGSELRALLQVPGASRSLNIDAVNAMVRLGAVPGALSIYRSFSKVEPGTYLEILGPQDAVSRRWWNAYEVLDEASDDPFRGSLSEAAERVGELLNASVRRRLVADVPVGAFLSGGIDSSLVAWAAIRQAGALNTYSIGFDREEYDETQYARAVAKALGTVHHEHIVTEAEALSVIPQLPSIWDEPFGDSSQIPTLLVARHARRDVTVALSGDGGDELFGGYRRYQQFARLGPLLEHRRINSLLGRAARIGRSLASMVEWTRLSRQLDTLHRLTVRNTAPDVYRALVAPLPPDGVSKWSNVQDWPFVSSGHVDSALAYDTVTYLPDDILVKVDRAAMAHSLETRIPFLDEQIFRFAWSLPAEHRWKGAGGKAVLRLLAQGVLPERLASRPKQGFGIPIHDWLRGELRDWAADLIEGASFSSSPVADKDRVLSLWTAHKEGRRDAGYALWPVLMFEAWRHHHPR